VSTPGDAPTAGPDGSGADGTAESPTDAVGGPRAEGHRRRNRDRPVEAGTRAGTAALVVTSVGLAALLGGAVGSPRSVGLGVVAAVAFAASLRLASRDRSGALALPLSGAFSLVVGAAVVAAIGSVTLAFLATSYPVTSVDQVQPAGLRVVSATMVAAGATMATVGGVAAVDGSLNGASARTYADVAVKTFLVPLGLAALLIAPTALGGATDADPTLPALLAGVIALPFDLLALAAFPPGEGTHLLSFTALVAATAGALSRALAVAPLPEMLTGERRQRVGRALDRARFWLGYVAVGAAVAVSAALAELVVEQAVLVNVLGPAYGPLAAVTNAVALRLVGVAVLLGSLAVWTVGGLLGRAVRTDAGDVAAAVGPFLGGVAVVGLAALAHGVVLEPALGAVAASLPGEFGTAFDRQSALLVETLGSVAVTLALAAGLVGLTAGVAVAVTAAVQGGLLDDRVTGPALAAVGLFVAGGFGPGAGLAPGVVLAGLVGSFLVWDAGEYGVTLAREVGRASSRSTFAHLGGTLAAGAVAAGLTWVIRDLAIGASLGTVPTLRAAFVAVLVGIVLLVAALR
jgi:hypothetical protein